MFKILSKLYFYKFNNKTLDNYFSRIIVRVFNHFLPTYFELTGSFTRNRLDQRDVVGDEKYIVSLTTFPARIERVWLTIESILRQDDKPNSIILWLYKGEFKGKDSLPIKLIKLENRGLEIKFCDENLMPHKKYFYTLKENPKANIITIDDDMFYPPNLISNLKRFHTRYPKSIICPITRRINIDIEKVYPYSSWTVIKTNIEPSLELLTMGGGGTLFPKDTLDSEVNNIDSLKETALKADDLWLKIMSLKKGTKIVSIAGEYSRYFILNLHRSKVKLMDSNIGGNQNDIIFKNLLDRYKIKNESFIDS